MNENDTLIKPWHGIPREEIAWYPTVVAERCLGCGLCVTSCGRKVYRFNYEDNLAVVEDPFHCMVGCSTCATICPGEAIEFPSRGYIQQLIRKRKVVRQSKDMLQAHPDLYGLKTAENAKE
jgi:CDP-4-dehydro-6-deoxyglucose reductase